MFKMKKNIKKLKSESNSYIAAPKPGALSYNRLRIPYSD